MAIRWWRLPKLHSVPQQRSHSRRQAEQLTIEHLEDRTVPAPITGALPVPVVSLAYNNVNATPSIANFFASDLIQDTLFRAPDASSVQSLTKVLNSGTFDGGKAFSALLASPAFQGNVQPVLSFFQLYLGRSADLAGANLVCTAVQNGLPIGQALANLMGTAEFIGRNGNVLSSPSASFASFVYQAALLRAPTPAELSAFTQQTDTPLARGNLVFTVLTSAEILSRQPKLVAQDVVNAAYLGLWNASPDSRFATFVSNFSSAASTGNAFINDSRYIGLGAARNYIVGLFENILNRDPDFGSYRQARSGLLGQQITDQNLSSVVFGSKEFATIDQPLETFYALFFKRAVDPSILTLALAPPNNAASMSSLLQMLASTPEFTSKNGNLLAGDPNTFVNNVFKTILGRTPSSTELTNALSNLNANATGYGQVLLQLLMSPEALTTTPFQQNTVNLQYQTFLGRAPSSSEQSSMVTFLKANNVAKLTGQFLTSTEFAGNGFKQNIQHVIVIYQENWSFDALYGLFPGANGLANAKSTIPQVDRFGNPIKTVPQPLLNGQPDPRFPSSLPVGPYNLNQYLQPGDKTGDIVHKFYTEQLQIDNGLIDKSNGSMDKFVSYSDNGGLVQSNFDATNLPEGVLAQQYTIDDAFFHSAFGGSYLNHQFLIAAQAPQWSQPIPSGFVSSFDPTTKKLVDSNLTSDGKNVVNTTFSTNLVPSFVTPGAATLENSINDSNPNDATRPFETNIGDELSGAGVSWKWYSGGWNAAVNLQVAYQSGDPNQTSAAQAPFNDVKNPLNLFQWHHQPFAYFDNYKPTSANGQAHLQDEQNFFNDLKNGTLPAVSFVKPLGPDNEHPGYASLLQGQQHVASIIQALQNSPYWGNTAVVITYDEHGGRWDHVTPPLVDKWGVGSRVPGIEVSPFAKRGVVDHTQYETDSILRTLELVYQLQSMGKHDGSANPLYNAFSFAPTDLIKGNNH